MISRADMANNDSGSRWTSPMQWSTRRRWLTAVLLLAVPSAAHAQMVSIKRYSTPSPQGRPLWEGVLVDDLSGPDPISLDVHSGTGVPESAREDIRRISDLLMRKLQPRRQKHRLACYTSPDGRSLVAVGVSTSIDLSKMENKVVDNEIIIFPDWTVPSEYRHIREAGGASFLSNNLILVSTREALGRDEKGREVSGMVPWIISLDDPDLRWSPGESSSFDSMRDDGRCTLSGRVLVIGQVSEKGFERVAIVFPDELSEDGKTIETYGWLHGGRMLAVIVRSEDGEGRVFLLKDEGDLIAKLKNRINSGYGAIGDDMLHFATEGQQYLARIEEDGTSKVRRAWSGPTISRQNRLYGERGFHRIRTQRMKAIAPSGAQVADISRFNNVRNISNRIWIKVVPTGREQNRSRSFRVNNAILSGWLALWPDASQSGAGS